MVIFTVNRDTGPDEEEVLFIARTEEQAQKYIDEHARELFADGDGVFMTADEIDDDYLAKKGITVSEDIGSDDLVELYWNYLEDQYLQTAVEPGE